MRLILLITIGLGMFFTTLGQVPQKIFVEHFTNTLCSVCASRNPGFYNNLKNQTNTIHLSIHSSAPYTQCLLYQQNVIPSDARRFFYTVNSTPTLFINGIGIPPSNNYGQPSLFSPFQGLTSPVSIRLEQQKYGEDSLHLNIIVKTEASHSLGTQQLWVGLAEDTVFYAGPNGEQEHYDVFRAELDLKSISIPSVVGDSLVYEYKAYANANWDFNRIFAFAMIQNASNKSVVQAEATTPNTNNGFITHHKKLMPLAEEVQVFPNPVRDFLFIKQPYEIKTMGRLCNASGQVVREWQMEKEGAIHIKGLTAGLYALYLENAKGFTSQRIVIQE